MQGRIFCFMGKSATGKDTIFNRLKDELSFESIVPYTTRPIRDSEEEGREYHFVTEEEYQALNNAGRIIEQRCYETMHGPWRYFTVDDSSIDFTKSNYALIGTLDVYNSLVKYYGKERVVPIYIEVEDGQRLMRALLREMLPENQKYRELCRRFIADSDDFSEGNIQKAGITRRFENIDLDRCIDEVRTYIREEMNSNGLQDQSDNTGNTDK